jgi:p-hydroxybenzoate 3-monooxygenase
MRTEVGIIGAGPAGLFLSHLLRRAGIDCVVLEARSRDYVEQRVRAGVLEQGTVELIDALGLGARMHRECMVDRGLDIRFRDGLIHLDLPALTGKVATIYGQQELVKDLIAARIDAGLPMLFDAEVTGLEGLAGNSPSIVYRHDDRAHTLPCAVIAGCDGFHGFCRSALPADAITTYDHVFPFGWLGILSESPPIREMTYVNHERGFALFSRRSPRVSRLYLQCRPDENPDEWPDARLWDEFHLRLGDAGRGELAEGRIVQKGVNTLRACVTEPMRHGMLFLAGDAAHIVPPTGAKGLNLAVADVRVLARALAAFLRGGRTTLIDGYSERCLARVWKTVRYSTYMTNLLHRFEERGPFEARLQLAELAYIAGSRIGQAAIAENYVGLPFEEE